MRIADLLDSIEHRAMNKCREDWADWRAEWHSTIDRYEMSQHTSDIGAKACLMISPTENMFAGGRG
jgi:hypothetical protein